MSASTRHVHDQLVGHIRDYQAAHGSPPSYEDLRRRMGFASRSAVEYHLGLLEEAGRITREPGKIKSVLVVDGRRSRRNGKRA